MHADPVVAHGGEEIFGAGNKLAECFARNGTSVTVDRAGNEYAIDRADAEQVVNIHHEAVLSGFAEACRVASFFVMQVGECALGARAVGVDNVTLVGVAS